MDTQASNKGKGVGREKEKLNKDESSLLLFILLPPPSVILPHWTKNFCSLHHGEGNSL